MTDMTIERAQEIAGELVEMRIKWGNNYRLQDHPAGMNGCMDAIVMLAKSGNIADATLRTDLAKSNRQLGAATSREAKLKKQIKTLKETLTAREILLGQAETKVTRLTDQLQRSMGVK